MKWLPYLLQLSRRPGALKYTGIYQMLPDPIQEYLTECNRGDTGKVLKTIAAITVESGYERAVETVNALVPNCYLRSSRNGMNVNRINTNIEFSRWVNVFYDQQMTGAIIDQVLHH